MTSDQMRRGARYLRRPTRLQVADARACVEAFHPQRMRFEMIVERKLRRRQLIEDGNVEITGRDRREKTPSLGQSNSFDKMISAVALGR